MRLEAVPFRVDDAFACVFAHRDHDDKYSRGVVGLLTGSVAYPGAAVLGAEAAVRAGAGMVRYVGPDAVGRAVLARRPEVVLGEGRLTSAVIGSGVADLHADARSADAGSTLERGVPCVVDAGGLSLVGSSAARAPLGSAILTPHAGEFARLAARAFGDRGDADAVPVEAVRAEPAAWAARLARSLGTTVLLKGAETIVVSADASRAWRVESPTNVLATAGTGDVLAGALGALVATAQGRDEGERPSLDRLAAAAAWIHGRAALLASRRALDPATRARDVVVDDVPRASGRAPVAALDVAAAVPAVIGALLGDDA